MQNPKPLASLYSWAGRFESHLVGNSEDRFSRDEAHKWNDILSYWRKEILLWVNNELARTFFR